MTAPGVSITRSPACVCKTVPAETPVVFASGNPLRIGVAKVILPIVGESKRTRPIRGLVPRPKDQLQLLHCGFEMLGGERLFLDGIGARPRSFSYGSCLHRATGTNIPLRPPAKHK